MGDQFFYVVRNQYKPKNDPLGLLCSFSCYPTHTHKCNWGLKLNLFTKNVDDDDDDDDPLHQPAPNGIHLQMIVCVFVRYHCHWIYIYI